MTYQFIQLEYLDTISAGDLQLRRTLLNMVSTELQDALPKIVQAYQEQHWEVLHGLVHQLKTTLAYTGNDQLIKANQNILLALEEKKHDAGLEAQLLIFEELCSPVLKELKKELDTFQLT